MKRSLCGLLLLLVSSFWMVGCPSTPPCQADADCQGGLICEASVCKKGCETGSCDKGQLCDGKRCKPGCNTKDNCPTDAPVCKDNKCVACVNSDDCKGSNAGKVCDANVCRDCLVQSECEGQLECTKGKCVEPGKPCPPSQIEYPKDSGICVDSCTTLGCDAQHKVCDDKDQAPACGDCLPGFNKDGDGCTVGCVSRDDCVEGKICKDGQCLFCQEKTECKLVEACIAGLCDKCQKDQDCSNPKLICDNGGCKDRVNPCKPGELEHPIDSRKCIPSCETLKCKEAQRQCQDPQKSGKCGDCLNGYKENTANVCEKKCASDADCGGKKCKEELCIGCKDNQECDSGQKLCKVGVCTACANDAECGADKECDSHLGQSICRTRCPTGFERDPDTRFCVDACAFLKCNKDLRVCANNKNPVNCGACITGYKENAAQKCEKKCSDKRDCPDAAPRCDQELCGPCTTKADCPGTRICQSGTCQDPNCPAGQFPNPGGQCVDSCDTLGCETKNQVCDNPSTSPRCGACIATHELKNGTCQPKACTASCTTNQVCEGQCVNRCQPGFAWDPKANNNQGACITADLFCKQVFGADASTFLETNSAGEYQVEAIQNPNWKSGDSLDSKYMHFCLTKLHYYGTPGNGTNVSYGLCDRDQDGWINEEAYQIVLDSRKLVGGVEKAYKKFVRCVLNTAQRIVYLRTPNIHNDGTSEFVEDISQSPVDLWETKRNDGDPTIAKAAYPKDQDPNTSLKTDFDPAAINSFTKACAATVDLNHNGTFDYLETPATKASKAALQPFLKWSYYTELAYGYFATSYKTQKGRTEANVYVIQERSRRAAEAQGGLALKCDQQGNNDHWRDCILRDDQVCNGTVDKGRSPCWYAETVPNSNPPTKQRTLRRGLPSLFKCVQFSESSGTPKDFFDVDNYGTGKNYTRSVCSLDKSAALDSGKLSARTDSLFVCNGRSAAADKPVRDDVGWTCRTFQKHTRHSTDVNTDYAAGCVQECTDNEYDADNPTRSLLPCPGTQVSGDRICLTDSTNYGKGSCGMFLHYGHISSIGCTGSSCSPVSTGGDFKLYDASLTGATAVFDPAQAGAATTTACVGSTSTSGATMCLIGGLSSEGP